MIDPDVALAQEKWDRGEWDCFDVARSILLQWGDRHVNDADGDGSNYNAHSLEDVAVFGKAVGAAVLEVASWVARLAAVKALVP